MRIFMALLLLTALWLSGCEADDKLSGASLTGQVVEEGTGAPIAQAIAVVRWKGTVATIEGRTVCYHAETALTDAQGRFSTPAWEEKEKRSYGIRTKGIGAGLIVTAYKNGYLESMLPHREPNIVYLEKSKETGDARFEKLANSVFGGMKCLEAGASEANLYVVFKAAYEEAKTLELVSEKNKKGLEMDGKNVARIGAIRN